MTIPEACELVIQASAMAKGGDLFVLDMGEPIKILDLAKNAIKLSGYTLKDEDNPAGDIAIDIIGLRPGEKLFEELLIGDAIEQTPHPRILRARESCLDPVELNEHLNELKSRIADIDELGVLKQIKKMVPEFNHQLHSSENSL